MKIQDNTPIIDALSSASVIKWQDCIAKTYVDVDSIRHFGMTVWQHSIAAAYVFEELIKKMPRSLRKIIPRDGICKVALHDVGKISPGFQNNKIRQEISIVPYCEDHSEVTEVTIAAIAKYESSRVSKMLGAHHGSYHKATLPADYEIYGGEEWQKEREYFIGAIENNFGILNTGKMSSRSETLMLYMISISDWIASDEKHFDQSRPWTDNEIKEQAKIIVGQMEGWKDIELKYNMQFSDMFPGFMATPMQKEVIKIVDGPGVYIIEAGTGEGKTEAALASGYISLCRYDMNGIYFALPTRLTSNKIYERFLKWMEKVFTKATMPRLIHGQSWAYPAIGGKQFSPGGRWFTPNRRAMLEHFGIGTIDQALMGVLNVRFNYIRLGGLFRKVVILDEVHSYDAYTSCLICDLVKKLKKMQCIVIILSATLTRSVKAKILGISESILSKRGGYPMITYQKKGKIREKHIGRAKQQVFDIAYKCRSFDVIQKAVELAKRGANVLWVENSVGDSVNTYNEISTYICGLPLGLIHSRFLPDRRLVIETEWLDKMGPYSINRPRGCIVVATQVIEQSVDVDFDMLVTAIAPSDFLIQRMGRVWRHLINKRPVWMKSPEVWILGPRLSVIKNEEMARKAFGTSSLVYNLFVIWRAAKIWSKILSVRLPEQTRKILEATYSKPLKKESKWIKSIYHMMKEHAFLKIKQAQDSISCHLAVKRDDEDDIFGNGEMPYTRKQSVPTQQIVICRNICFINQIMRLTLYVGGEVIDIPIDEVPFDKKNEIKKIALVVNQNMLKVPYLTKHFDECDDTMLPLNNVLFGNAVAVRINSNNELIQVSGKSTGYKYTEETGAIRIDL